ncbi:MAG: hypothetical protein B6229_08380 [Spirochaetaceae bacterium 4572_7]|nr:MAG: hypothetical protein B6229_08380 [Spirochaetaceae bacterium 4572_7]
MCKKNKEMTILSVKRGMYKKILWSLYAGFVFYTLFSLFSGAVGFTNMKALSYFKNTIKTHVELLQIKSIRLEDEIFRLSDDSDRLKVAVRPLGLFESNQKVIKVLNYKVPNTLYDIDSFYNIPSFNKLTNQNLLLSIVLSVILFITLLFVGVIRDTFKRG